LAKEKDGGEGYCWSFLDIPIYYGRYNGY